MVSTRSRKKNPDQNAPSAPVNKQARHQKSVSKLPPRPNTPAPPANADPIMTENSLHMIPPTRRDFDRPWFLYDYVDPAAKFRVMEDNYNWEAKEDYVPRGEDPGALVDDAQVGAIPVDIDGYQQKFQIEVPDQSEAVDDLFGYAETDLCKIIVYEVVYEKGTSKEVRELQKPTKENLTDPEEYKIHAGYRHVLLGFLREIEHMHSDNNRSHNCLFRATYLIKVLDHFAEELPAIVRDLESRWRSCVLNPLLQRRLLGVYDQEPTMVRNQVGKTPEDAARFYLTSDPINPANTPALLRGILYVWPVRWSLIYLRSPARAVTYDHELMITNHLLGERERFPDEEYPKVPICQFEAEVVKIHKLTLLPYYRHLIEAAGFNDPPSKPGDDGDNPEGDDMDSSDLSSLTATET